MLGCLLACGDDDSGSGRPDAGMPDGGPELSGPCPVREGMVIARHHPNLEAVARRGDRIVAVGDSSAVLALDPDGECRTSSGGVAELNAVIQDGPGFLAGGTFGELYVSDDGMSWRHGPTVSGLDYVEDILRTGDMLVLVTSYGGGTVWTRDAAGEYTQRATAPRALYAVAAGPSSLVAVGEGGMVLVSTDAISWNEVTSDLSREVRGVAYGAAGFVAVAERAVTVGTIVGVSVDGTTWTTAEVPDVNLLDIAFAAGVYVAVGRGGAIQTSPDGMTWTPQTSGTTHDLKAIEHDGTSLLAVGAAGTILESVDGVTWTAVRAGDPTDFSSVAFGAGVFVASTDRGVSTSTDGQVWTHVAVSGDPRLRDIAFADGRFVAVGGTDAPVIVTSVDGTTWQVRAVTGTNYLSAVAHGSAGWLAVGEHGDVATSPDGVTWTLGNVGADQLLDDVAAAGGTYVVVGDGSTVHVTTNGTDWTVASAPETSNLFAAGSVGSTLLVVNGPDVYTSTTGTTWTRHASVSGANGLLGVSSGLPQAIGFGSSGRIYGSADGVTWTDVDLDFAMRLHQVARSDTRWVYVGVRGLVVTSPATSHPF